MARAASSRVASGVIGALTTVLCWSRAHSQCVDPRQPPARLQPGRPIQPSDFAYAFPADAPRTFAPRRLAPSAAGRDASRARAAARSSRGRSRRRRASRVTQALTDAPAGTARQRDAGRRAEPDHRAAEADGVGEEAPVVAALAQARARSAGCCRTPPTRSRGRARPATTPPAAPRPASSTPHSTRRAGRRCRDAPTAPRSSRAARNGATSSDRDPHRQADDGKLVEPGR